MNTSGQRDWLAGDASNWSYATILLGNVGQTNADSKCTEHGAMGRGLGTCRQDGARFPAVGIVSSSALTMLVCRG